MHNDRHAVGSDSLFGRCSCHSFAERLWRRGGRADCAVPTRNGKSKVTCESSPLPPLSPLESINNSIYPLFQDRSTILEQLVCNERVSEGAVSTDGDLLLLSTTTMSDEETTTTDDDDQEREETTREGATAGSESETDTAINKIVSEIQSITTNETLSRELEPMKPRKQQPLKKYNPAEKKKYKKSSEDRKYMKTVLKADSLTTTTMVAETKTLAVDELNKQTKDIELADANVREERVRRETLETSSSTTGGTRKDEPEAEINISSTTAENSFTENLFVESYSEDPISASVGLTTVDGGEETTEAELITNVTELDRSTFATTTTITEEINHLTTTTTPLIETIDQSTTKSEMDDFSSAVHTDPPKGTISHPMHMSTDMTREQEAMQLREKEKKATNPQDHFVPPMLLVKAKFTAIKQHVNNMMINSANYDGQKENRHNAIETQIGEATNDISKFYPASTEKAQLNEDKEVLLEIPQDMWNKSTSTAASVVPNETTTANEDKLEVEPPTKVPGEVKDEAKKYHSEFTFSNIENYKPYRPNRRRQLTKSPSHSYLRKILG